MNILKGKQKADAIIQGLKGRSELLRGQPVLTIISVDPTEVSLKYLAQKERAAKEAGIRVMGHQLSHETGKEILYKKIQEITEQETDGMIIQLPLPMALDHERHRYLNLIPEEVDIDCLSERWRGRLETGNIHIEINSTAIRRIPPIAGAVLGLIKETKKQIRGMHIALVGWGDLVGKAILPVLLHEGATVTVCHEYTKNLAEKIKNADCIITGAGAPNLIRGNMVKSGAIVIDCGTSTDAGRIVGDVDQTSVAKRAKWLTPVPGGVGPLTVAFVMRNVLDVAEARQRKK